MRRIVFAMSLVVMLSALSRIAEAGEITYLIQSYPADQEGAALSGAITTDGVIGILAATDVLSWSWTITPLGGTPFTLSSSDTGTTLTTAGDVVASQSSITVGLAPQGGLSGLGLLTFDVASDLEYARMTNRFGEPISNEYDGITFAGGHIWQNDNPVMGGTDPWVIAQVASVPEPASVTLAGLGAACGIACYLARSHRPCAARFFIRHRAREIDEPLDFVPSTVGGLPRNLKLEPELTL
jgi:hypothetical protein